MGELFSRGYSVSVGFSYELSLPTRTGIELSFFKACRIRLFEVLVSVCFYSSFLLFIKSSNGIASL